MRYMRSNLLLWIPLVLLGMMAPAWGADVKDGHSCGCAVDAYSVYGAGQDTCQTFMAEHATNLDSGQVDGTYGQTLGWIAGYMSATNRGADTRDVFDMDLTYVAHLVAKWCQQNPDDVLSDAMNALSDSRTDNAGLLQSLSSD